MEIRRLVFSLGFRYRLRVKDLPGRPDLVFRGRKKVIFVHGCFWHQHGCGKYKMPMSRLDFWLPKLQKNIERDRAVQKELQDSGWKYLVIWECQLKDRENTREIVNRFLEEK